MAYREFAWRRTTPAVTSAARQRRISCTAQASRGTFGLLLSKVKERNAARPTEDHRPGGCTLDPHGVDIPLRQVGSSVPAGGLRTALMKARLPRPGGSPAAGRSPAPHRRRPPHKCGQIACGQRLAEGDGRAKTKSLCIAKFPINKTVSTDILAVITPTDSVPERNEINE